MRKSPTIESPMFPDGIDRMGNRGSSEETNCLAVDVDHGITDLRKIQKQPSKTSNKNDGPTVPGIKKMSSACMQANAKRLTKNVERKISDQLMIKKMSFACMQASAERLSKNFDRKMSKPIIKKESKVNVNDKQLKKVPNMMTTATVPRRSVFEVTKTRLLVPLTPESARLKHQCIHENAVTVSYMPSKKDVAVQTVPLELFQKQPAEMSSADGRRPPQPLSKKTLNNDDAPFKDIVKNFDKCLRKNMKTTIQFKKYIDNLSARRIVAAASTHDYWKYLVYFSTFSIGVISTYMLNYGWYHLQRIKNAPHLLK